eukprot:CAMPEP_0168558916 /NCGR_PEP_ID=MMETSP0413-20121227/10235_1 /TAXON_ID=136452 /ORGANISM="Filamoeba nolandi, Strain NC-AS-23-1" /LENGTH=331 /DNA_ID=CAMNT_0008590089 /DNA_START=51 /DNA_END=1046 /DNA_ORIENTATION=+
MPFSPSNSEFFVEKQESLAVDKFTKNGSSKELHIVAKSIPFVIHVASSLDLNNSSFEAKLIYDAEDEKEVETVKSDPMEFVVHVNSMGDKAAVEVRIFVLSSQHEGAFFRVKLSITEKDTEQTFTTFSNPIKVVSKRNQVKKMLERNELSREDNPHIEVSPTFPSKRPAPSSANVDNLQEVLLRLEEQQREQAQLLRQLVSQKSNPVSFDCGTVPSPSDMDFETAFQNFLAAFQKVPSSERSSKLRKVMQTVEASQPMNEFLDVANAECGRSIPDSLMQSILTLPSGNADDINCQYSNCPPKSESELEAFYNDFFQEPLTPPTVAQMMISS